MAKPWGLFLRGLSFQPAPANTWAMWRASAALGPSRKPISALSRVMAWTAVPWPAGFGPITAAPPAWKQAATAEAFFRVAPPPLLDGAGAVLDDVGVVTVTVFVEPPHAATSVVAATTATRASLLIRGPSSC